MDPCRSETSEILAGDRPRPAGAWRIERARGRIEADRVLEWLKALIAQTCAAPPALVGQILGGAIAARFAVRDGRRLERLVLVDALGLAPFRPAPEFGHALTDFLAAPGGETHDGLWRYCAFDLDRLRDRMGDGWNRIRNYNLDRALAATLHATQQSLMEQFGVPAIPEAELSRIVLPTTLIWVGMIWPRRCRSHRLPVNDFAGRCT